MNTRFGCWYRRMVPNAPDDELQFWLSLAIVVGSIAMGVLLLVAIIGTVLGA